VPESIAMKVSAVLFLCLLTGTTALSPVTRIVELLKGLSETIEKEGKKEEDLYETYVCWGKSVIEQKTASNAAGESRIEELETYIADLDAGRIELTSERTDLEKEIAAHLSDLEEMKANREKENTDFKDAEAEMSQAVSALKSAIDTLGDATKDHKEGVFLAMRSGLKNGVESFQKQQASLRYAVKLGERFLEKADATFLRRILTGDVPKADWKKLNRKATFKMAYKARSFKIQDVLKKMHSTFSANLEEARANEAEAQNKYEELSNAKSDQLGEARAALQKMASENGEKGQSKEESQQEVDDLKKQVENDTRFIKETEEALANKKKEWKARSVARTGELAAISKAINILYNDDARDNFKKSFASQEGFFFLQTGQTASAAGALRAAARKSGDSRLLSLAAMVAAPGNKGMDFAPIVDKINKLIADLKGEQEEDLETKENCERGRMDDTRQAALVSRDIDEMTDEMNKLRGEIAEHEKEIAEKTAQRKQTREELAAADEIRKEEHAEWKVSDAEDAEAAATVKQAKDVLANHYKQMEKDAFLQQDAPQVVAGEAPPPPPPTFDGSYGGKQEENQGIVSIMEMVEEDINKDRQKGKQEEDDAQGRFDKFEKESKDQIKDLSGAISDLEGTVGQKEKDVARIGKEQGTAKGELDAVMKKMADISPNCEYFAVNYKLRFANRNVEIDGLNKAKTILEGGTFAKPVDPNREMKPGDAFLQRK